MNEKRRILYIIWNNQRKKLLSTFKNSRKEGWNQLRVTTKPDNPPSFKTPSVPVIPIEIPRRKSICSISYGTRHHVKIIDVTDLIYRTSTVTALAETCLLNFEKADLWREKEREEKNERKKRDKFQKFQNGIIL